MKTFGDINSLIAKHCPELLRTKKAKTKTEKCVHGNSKRICLISPCNGIGKATPQEVA